MHRPKLVKPFGAIYSRPLGSAKRWCMPTYQATSPQRCERRRAMFGRCLADDVLLPGSLFFLCLKEKEELQGMLPVDSRQLENVKVELLKLTKKETADCQLWHNVARIEERKKEKNKERADWQTLHNVAKREEPKKQKNKEIADCQSWYNMQENAV
ncbi:hypothetical protein AVEN_157476-1 [Araneus ventricosus]|uniref:Uncharacterized protein n=1 Tax=Araneus ventricosus TaxID=182803 RepID=A0A4Y2V054_ARAVE|nr:hypothetical protein AVEN_157476-1 [Araneus ventricosus]